MNFHHASVDENPEFCSSISCQIKKKNKYVIPVVASAAALFVLLIALTIWWSLKRRRHQGKTTTGLVTEKTEILLSYYK